MFNIRDNVQDLNILSAGAGRTYLNWQGTIQEKNVQTYQYHGL